MDLFSILTQKKPKDAGGDYRPRDQHAPRVGVRQLRRPKGGGAVPVSLPLETKRARLRLVRAMALSLTAAVGLPTLAFESKTVPFVEEIRLPGAARTLTPLRPRERVDIADSLDRGESIVAPPKTVSAAHTLSANSTVRASNLVPRTAVPNSARHDELRIGRAPVRNENRTQVRTTLLAVNPEDRTARKAVGKLAAKASVELVRRKSPDPEVDMGRAQSRREFVVQAAALADKGKVHDLQGKLKEAGIPYFTQRLTNKSGELIRIRVGPLNKGEKEIVRAKLIMLGLSPNVVATP